LGSCPLGPLAVALLATLSLVLQACCHGDTSEASFEWPTDEECPPPEEAALYLPGFVDPATCGTHLVSVDAPALHTSEGCVYPVTVEICPCFRM
jgi:hypothetical protein